ncbi:ecto-ADP-ribosyltransferase 5-like, partial [Pyxicephalus adspersus]|uniref:ecto-ADP-ribosyltransferase 5-like n=1 Tax=Pyxicephalus adspersus TaxID=30357 RepID=UPI003B5C8013
FFVQVVSQRVQLGIYQDSFDDQYVGCADKMESLAPDIFMAERQKNKELEVAWIDASETWAARKALIKPLPDGFIDEYGIPFLVYIMAVSGRAVRMIQIKMSLESGIVLCTLHFVLSTQMSHQVTVFDIDDQYTGCEKEMENEMAKVLQEEMKNNQFAVMWYQASYLNKNISVAGMSKNFYMNNFHFKSLHSYLTQALQMMRTVCTKKSPKRSAGG